MGRSENHKTSQQCVSYFNPGKKNCLIKVDSARPRQLESNLKSILQTHFSRFQFRFKSWSKFWTTILSEFWSSYEQLSALIWHIIFILDGYFRQNPRLFLSITDFFYRKTTFQTSWFLIDLIWHVIFVLDGYFSDKNIDFFPVIKQLFKAAQLSYNWIINKTHWVEILFE